MNLATLHTLKRRIFRPSNALPRTETLRLSRGEALTVQLPLAGTLSVQQGRVWATFRAADRGRDADYFLTARNDLAVSGASILVLESWPLADGQSALLQWTPA